MKICCICSKENSGYKCPTCRKSYCSVNCCKKHKESVCEVYAETKSPDESKRPPIHHDYPTDDTVPPEKLELLRDCDEVNDCLKNPHVRDIINAILNDSDPTKAIGLAMTEPIFVELADACLKIVEPTDDEKPC